MIKAIDPINSGTLNQWMVSLLNQQIGADAVSMLDIGQKQTADANEDATGGSLTIMGIGLKMDLYI